ncbi:hypothetical protein [Candidatus Chloroploca asiatica]|uniref:Uncharacterized protein n=1 Tax=Candidatus Chloroploca asiatica TaxID=1506545 RepID=A0A2H3KPQ2_9CHLR|nr:hypothetical protein [Candidatus Chloroploca asiatica]PDW00253.1 hypothetical protein A9Q02_10565 [Candidatus Chloroploca asiatica]
MSSPRSDIVRLRDMLAAIEAIEQYSAGLDFAAFAAQQQVQHAMLGNARPTSTHRIVAFRLVGLKSPQEKAKVLREAACYNDGTKGDTLP